MKRLVLPILLLAVLTACGAPAQRRSALEHTCPVAERPRVERPASRIAVLVYHSLAPEATGMPSQHATVVAAEAFEEQVAWLASAGYYTPTLDELHAYLEGRLDLPERSAVITFDDGYESNYHYAHPVLCRYGMRAVLFKIGARNPNQGAFHPLRTTHLTWQQIDEMVRSQVWSVENHTFHGHDRIDGRPPLLVWTVPEITADLRRIAGTWAEHGLPEPSAIAYPFGEYNEQTLRAVRQAGLRLGFTIEHGFVTRGQDPLQLPRIAVFPEHTLERFQALVGG